MRNNIFWKLPCFGEVHSIFDSLVAVPLFPFNGASRFDNDVVTVGYGEWTTFVAHNERGLWRDILEDPILSFLFGDNGHRKTVITGWKSA